MNDLFYNHVLKLIKPFGQLYIINLLGDKPDEKKLSKDYFKMFEIANLAGLFYRNIDFQSLCSGHNLNGADTQAMALIERVKQFGFSSNDGKT